MNQIEMGKALGRIEQKIDDQSRRLDRYTTEQDAKNGLFFKVKSDFEEMQTKQKFFAGMILGFVGIFSAIGRFFLGDK